MRATGPADRPAARLLGLAVLTAVLVAGCSATSNGRPVAQPRPTRPAGSPTTVQSSSPAATTSTPHPTPTAHRSTRHHTRPTDHPAAAHKATPTPTPTPRPTHRSTASPHHGTLPVELPTHDARQVVTVTAPSTGSTTATLQSWRRGAHGWHRVGGSVLAWLGSEGMTWHASESRSATPMGSFTLTEAFGHDPDPGSGLPYRRTNPDDWWISQPGPLYNTFQECAANCGFTRGAPNEHLYYETPYYDYAAVIDYNRSPVRQGAGSAFFLHVTVGEPTAGCVSIDRADLVRILRWLRPSDHPRILIDTATR